MATFDELYNQLKDDNDFKTVFESKDEFYNYLNTNENADSYMNDMFGVANASQLVKKKDQRSSSLNFLGGGEKPKPQVKAVEDGKPKNWAILSPEARRKWEDEHREGLPNIFRGMTSDVQSRMMGDQAVTPQPSQKDLLDYKYEQETQARRGVSDISQRGLEPSKTVKAAEEKAKVDERLKKERMKQQQGEIRAAVRYDAMGRPTTQTEGEMETADENIGKLTGKFNQIIEADEQLKEDAIGAPAAIVSSAMGYEGEGDKTKRLKNLTKQLNNEIIEGLKDNVIADIEMQIKDNYDAPNAGMTMFGKVGKEGIFKVRDRDGYLDIDRAYLDGIIDDYFIGKKPGEKGYIPDTEKGNEIRRKLRGTISGYFRSKYLAEIENRVADKAVGKGPFDEKKIKEDFNNINQGFINNVESYRSSILGKLNSTFDKQKSFLEKRRETLKPELFGTTEQYVEAVNQFNVDVAEFKEVYSAEVIRANKELKQEIEKEDKERMRLLDEYSTNLKGQGKEYFAKREQAIKEYRKSQLDANAFDFGDFDSYGNLIDNLQASLSGITAAMLDYSGLKDAEIGFVNDFINTMSGIATGNQYMGRSMSKSKSFSEGFGAFMQQVTDQFPTIALSVGVQAATGNPYLTSSVMMYSDMAREAFNAKQDILDAGGSQSEVDAALKNITNVHLAMAPLYLAEGSLLFGSGAKVGSTSFARNWAMGSLKDYPFELIQEFIQEYTSASSTGALDVRDATGQIIRRKSFNEWLGTDGKSLAIDILPTVVAFGAGSSYTQTKNNREIEKSYADVKKFLGDKGKIAYFNDLYTTMGENGVYYVPDMLHISGEITQQERDQLVKQLPGYIAKIRETQDAGLMNRDDALFYAYRLMDKESAQKQLKNATTETAKNAAEAKLKSAEKDLQDLVSGKKVSYSKIKYADGRSVIVSNEDMSQALDNMNNATTRALVNETRLKNGEAVPIATLETENEQLNKKLNDRFKDKEKRQNFEGVEGGNFYKGNQKINFQDNNNVDVVAEKTGVDSKVVQMRFDEAKDQQARLEQEIPGVEIVLLDDAEYQKALNKNSNGEFLYEYDKDTNKYRAQILINLNKANSRTIAHETSHAFMLKKFGEDILAFEDFKKGLVKVMNATDIANMTLFASNYQSLDRTEEFMAEFAGVMSNTYQELGEGEEARLKKTKLQRVASYVSEFVSNLTNGRIVPFKDIANVDEAMEFFNSFSKSLNKDAVQEQTTSEVPLQPESQVGQEMEEGAPQTEPQAAAQKGQEEEITSKPQKVKTEATTDDFVLPFGKYKGQWMTTTPPAYRNWLAQQYWYDPKDYMLTEEEAAQQATTEQSIEQQLENPITTEDVQGREIEQGYEVMDEVITIDAEKGKVDRGPQTKAQVNRDFEITENDFVDVNVIDGKKAVGFLGDTQLAGTTTSPDGTELNGGGGPGFVKYANRNLEVDEEGFYKGRAAVWASTFEDSTTKLMKKFAKGELALIGAQQNTGVLGNRRMLMHFADLMNAAVKRGANEQEILTEINSKLDTNFKKGTPIKQELGGVENFTTIEEFIDYLDPFLSKEDYATKHGKEKLREKPVTYDLRNNIFGKIFNIGNHQKFGFPSIVAGKNYTYDKTILEYANDEMFQDAGYGDFVGYVEYDPATLRLEKVDETSDFYNPSYPYVITAERVRNKFFNNFIDGRAVFYDTKPTSLKANQTPFGLREKAQAARAIMGSMPQTTIEAQKIKERQKGFTSKSQLTEPSSDAWTTSLTQAQVDEIVGGDFGATLDEKVKEGKKHNTQIATTVNTYNKWNEWLGKNVPNFKDAKVLDVGAGLGHVHKAFKNKQENIQSYEPFFDKVQYEKYSGKKTPDFSALDASDVPTGQYDVVVNNAVLNVVPADIRESIVNTIGAAIKPGGIGIINVMKQDYLNSLIKKIDAGTSKNIKLSDSEVFVRESGKNTYQKGWKTTELQSYVQDVLGPDFSVEVAPKEITSGPTILIRKGQGVGTKAQVDELITESKKMGVPQRYKGDVGKFIGGDLYVHNSATDILPQAEMKKAETKLPADFNYEVVKYNPKTKAFSFIASPDWNTNPEPVVGDAYKVSADGNVSITKQKADPQIYHHKWNFVRDDYAGFDVAESIQRSIDWFGSVKPKVNMFKIGTQSYWQNEALPNLESTAQMGETTMPQSKSQIDPTQVLTDYQNDITNGVSRKDAYINLIEQGARTRDIKNALPPNMLDEKELSNALEEIASAAIDQMAETIENNVNEIASDLESMAFNNYTLEEMYDELKQKGYRDFEISNVMIEKSYGSNEELIELFGTDYNKTIENILANEEMFPVDYIEDLKNRNSSIKQVRKMSDLRNAFVESGMNFTDAGVIVDYLVERLNESMPAIQVMRDELEKLIKNPVEQDTNLESFKEIASRAGRILNMARGILKKELGDIINANFEKEGILLTEAQKQTLNRLVSDFNAAKERETQALASIEEGNISDADFDEYNAAKKEVGIANVYLSQFINNRLPTFWNEKITSLGSRDLLNLSTVMLSVVSNVENALVSSGLPAKAIMGLRDSFGGDMKGNTFSIGNWRAAYRLSKADSVMEMKMLAKYGNINMENKTMLEGIGSISGFRDAQIAVNAVKAFIKKATGNQNIETAEEWVDALDATLVKNAKGELQVRDGKNYTIVKSLLWSLNPGNYVAEGVGRAMAFGGDIAFGKAAATRGLIDYLNNFDNEAVEGNLFENLLKDKNGKVSDNTIRAVQSLMTQYTELGSQFEQLGLSRVFMQDNLVSTNIGKVRKNLKSGISRRYKELQKGTAQNRGVTIAAKNLLQATDVVLWTLMPFTKVPANFFGSALVKIHPAAALTKYLYTEIKYQADYKKFNKKYKPGTKLKTNAEKVQYEKDRIALFRGKRQAGYDASQLVFSSGYQIMGQTAAFIGAYMKGDDEKEREVFERMGLKGDHYNFSLHMDFITELFKTGNYDKARMNVLKKRGPYLWKDGDWVSRSGNLGFYGYAMGVYGNIDKAKKKNKQGALSDLLSTEKSFGWLYFSQLLTTGIDNIPMLQGISRLADVAKDIKSEQSSGKVLENFAASTIATSLAPFFPSFGSFVSKGDADVVRNANEIYPDVNDDASYNMINKIAFRVLRNVPLSLEMKENFNQFYKAKISAYGQELKYKATIAEEGTFWSYIQAALDPFNIRPLKSQTEKIQPIPELKNIDNDKRLKNHNFFDSKAQELTLREVEKVSKFFHLYENLTGRPYKMTIEGKQANMNTFLAHAMPNEKLYDGTGFIPTGAKKDEPQVLSYNLPDELYRREIIIRGNYLSEAMASQLQFMETKEKDIAKYIEDNNKEGAIDVIEKTLEDHKNYLQMAEESYENDYLSNRERAYLKYMYKKDVLNDEQKAKLVKLGLVNEQGKFVD